MSDSDTPFVKALRQSAFEDRPIFLDNSRLWQPTLRRRPGGGAPLHSRSSSSSGYSPSPRPKAKASTENKVDVPTTQSIEAELMTASSAFGQELGPVPTYPRSVQPTPLGIGRGRSAVAAPPNNNNRNHGGPQALTQGRYRGDSISNSSSSYSAQYTNWGRSSGGPVGLAGPAGASILPGEDASLHMSRVIHERLMALSHFIHRFPNVPANLASQHNHLCQELSQMANSAIHNLRLERDSVAGNQSELQDRYQQSLYAQSSVHAERENLSNRLKIALERVKSASKESHDWETRCNVLTRKVSSLETKAKEFKDYHALVTADWEKNDKRTYKQTQALEDEIKMLRGRIATLAVKADVPVAEALNVEPGGFPSPSIPSDSPESTRSLDKETKDDLLSRLVDPTTKGKAIDRSSSSFKPNPEAPAWKPPAAPDARNEKNRHSTHAPPQAEVGGPSNWPVIVRGSHNRRDVEQRSVTPNASSSSDVAPPRRQQAAASKLGPGHQFPPIIAREKEQWDVQDIRNAIEHLYTITKGYVVNCHLKSGDPPQVAYDRIEFEERPTWTYLLGLAYPNPKQAAVHIRYMLNVDTYRQHILMRVVLDYVFKKMLSPRVFLGMCAESDGHLSALQDEIAVLGQPDGSQTKAQARERQRVFDAHARIIKFATDSPTAEKFKEGTIKRHAEVLCRILKPLRSVSADDERAMRHLQLMADVTWEISSKVWMSGMTLNYQFLQCGSLYTYNTMDALNAGPMGYTIEELKSAHLRVSFVATPMLTVRDERHEGEGVAVHGVRKAGVLVMK